MEVVDCDKHGRQRAVFIGDPRELHVACAICYSKAVRAGVSLVEPFAVLQQREGAGFSIGVKNDQRSAAVARRVAVEKNVTQPGDKTAKANKEHKHALGEAPNRVANTYLANARGKSVVVYVEKQIVTTGILQEFDLYCFTVRPEGADDDSGDCLFFKGPGVWIRRA